MSKRIFIAFGHNNYKLGSSFNASVRDTFIEESKKLGYEISVFLAVIFTFFFCAIFLFTFYKSKRASQNPTQRHAEKVPRRYTPIIVPPKQLKHTSEAPNPHPPTPTQL